jgi:multidrug efflux pump subunit AcrA (membrane-fusion protein)
MFGLIAILVVAVGAATWELSAEVGGEYFAMYVLETSDYGASKRDPRTLNALVRPENERQIFEGSGAPVLLAAVSTDQAVAAGKVNVGERGLVLATPAATNAGFVSPTAKDDAVVISGPPPKKVRTNSVSDKKAEKLDAESLMALIGDTPHRRLNGTVFLPVAAQRVFGMRTVLGERARVPVVSEFPGRIVQSTASNSFIQVREDGYVEAAGERFPFVGQSVKRGQLLAYLKPAFDQIEEATVQEKVQELIGNINLARKRMARLEEVIYVRYRTGKIEAIRVEIEGFKERLKPLQKSLVERDELRARTDGFISKIDAHVGQFVHVGDTVFEIVDPSRLWVEADAYEPDVAKHILSASGFTTDGRKLNLKFLGGGLSLRNQAIPLYFEILDAVPGLSVDRPVTVVAQSDAGEIDGVKVPRESVIRTSEGQEILWERRSAEIFVAHQVSPLPIDAHSVLIPSKLGPGVRVVTSGAEVLSQIR